MAMIRRLLLAIASLILGLAGTVQTGAIAVAPAPAAMPAYSYDAAHHASVPTATASERGPPVAYERVTTDDAVDEVPPGIHRGNTSIHRNRYNQGVTDEMRMQDRQLHWWYRSQQMGGWDELGPSYYYDNWP